MFALTAITLIDQEMSQIINSYMQYTCGVKVSWGWVRGKKRSKKPPSREK